MKTLTGIFIGLLLCTQAQAAEQTVNGESVNSEIRIRWITEFAASLGTTPKQLYDNSKYSDGYMIRSGKYVGTYLAWENVGLVNGNICVVHTSVNSHGVPYCKDLVDPVIKAAQAKAIADQAKAAAEAEAKRKADEKLQKEENARKIAENEAILKKQIEESMRIAAEEAERQRLADIAFEKMMAEKAAQKAAQDALREEGERKAAAWVEDQKRIAEQQAAVKAKMEAEEAAEKAKQETVAVVVEQPKADRAPASVQPTMEAVVETAPAASEPAKTDAIADLERMASEVTFKDEVAAPSGTGSRSAMMDDVRNQQKEAAKKAKEAQAALQKKQQAEAEARKKEAERLAELKKKDEENRLASLEAQRIAVEKAKEAERIAAEEKAKKEAEEKAKEEERLAAGKKEEVPAEKTEEKKPEQQVAVVEENPLKGCALPSPYTNEAQGEHMACPCSNWTRASSSFYRVCKLEVGEVYQNYSTAFYALDAGKQVVYRKNDTAAVASTVKPASSSGASMVRPAY